MANLIEETVKKKTLKDLVEITEEQVKEEPKLTEDKINKAIEFLKNPPKHGGITMVMRKSKLSKSQIYEIKKEMERRIAELRTKEVVEEEGVAEVVKSKIIKEK